ncbi:hypothetical protein ACFW1M_03200 [Streptomyces inhibens]|uniref:hypothetical protein n=1 Tax=Streptomyces inhibens TaxID=2293571 RepID=UPI0036B55FC5
MLVRQRRAGREGRSWAREEWRLHLAALCLAPALSASAALLFERYVGLDRHTFGAWKSPEPLSTGEFQDLPVLGVRRALVGEDAAAGKRRSELIPVLVTPIARHGFCYPDSPNRCDA